MTASSASPVRRSLPGYVGLSGRAIRAGGAFIASGYVTPARLGLSLANGLIRATERADAIAFNNART